MSAIHTVANVETVLIGKSIARTASVQITDPSAASYIADGEVVVLNNLGVALTAGQTVSDSPWIQLVQRSGNNLKFSGRINGLGVQSYSGTSGVAAAQQVYVLGYDNTSGSIDMTTTAKILNISYKHDDQLWSERLMKRSYPSSGTTQAAVATEIAGLMNQDSYNANMGNSRAAGGWISAELLTDSTITADASTATVVKGSNLVTVTAANASVGEWLRIGTATTGPVYKLIAISGTTYTLNMPFQGASATSVNVDRITAANAALGNWGIKMTGLALDFGTFPYPEYGYMTTKFTVHPGSGWGSTTLTKTTEASRGKGTYAQVSEMESFASTMRGQQNRVLPLEGFASDAVSGTLYDSIQISYADPGVDSTAIMANPPAPQVVYIFLVDGASQQGTLRGQLNPWMASTPKQLANVGAL